MPKIQKLLSNLQKLLNMVKKYTWSISSGNTPKDLRLKSILINFYRKNRSWFFTGIILFFFLAIYNLLNSFRRPDDWIAFKLLFVYYGVFWIFYKFFDHAKALLLGFIFPFVLAFTILTLGTVGFYYMNSSVPISNHFFSAANLITLNSSEFKDLGGFPNVYLRTARLLGGFLAAYAFLLAFALAVGKENISRLYFWIYRNWSTFLKFIFGEIKLPLVHGESFSVVIGNGTKAIDLAYDLLDKDQRFVFLDGSETDYIENALKDTFCWYFKGKTYSKKSLQSTYFWEAKNVFVMNDEDELNFRAVHEIDDLLVHYKKENVKLNFHFEDQKLRESIHTLLERRSAQINTFSIAENTAIQLLNDRPIDRFSATINTAQVVIVGLNNQAKELILASVRMGHFTEDKYLYISVFIPANEWHQKEAFLNSYPMFDRKNLLDNYWSKEERSLIEYTFLGLDIKFKKLPDAEHALRNPQFNLYDLIKPTYATSIYVCLDDGMLNARFLDSVLPRLSFLKQREQRDIQVFSYYNYPDKNEQEYIETKLNSLASHIPVFCFGNMLHSCSVDKIENTQNTALAKRIALIYKCIYEGLKKDDTSNWQELNKHKTELASIGKRIKEDEEFTLSEYTKEKKNILKSFFEEFKKISNYNEFSNAHWGSLKEIDRESNLLAANHAAVKFRLFDKDPNDPTPWTDEQLNILSEIEHRRWNAEKLLIGWQPYINDSEWKTHKSYLRDQKFHNFLVTFDMLPEYEKSKDWVQVMGVVYSK
jgi:hypothetical protein